MNIAQYNELQKKHGDAVVFMYNEEYCFSMNDELMDDQDGIDLSWKFEDDCKDNNNITFVCAYGDDVCHMISVKELEELDKVNGLEEFVLRYIGYNTYTD